MKGKEYKVLSVLFHLFRGPIIGNFFHFKISGFIQGNIQ
jgi:hypothetical protein